MQRNSDLWWNWGGKVWGHINERSRSFGQIKKLIYWDFSRTDRLKERERRGQGEREVRVEREIEREKSAGKGRNGRRCLCFRHPNGSRFSSLFPTLFLSFAFAHFVYLLKNHFTWRVSFLKKSSSLLQYSFGNSFFRHSHLQSCLIYLSFLAFLPLTFYSHFIPPVLHPLLFQVRVFWAVRYVAGSPPCCWGGTWRWCCARGFRHAKLLPNWPFRLAVLPQVHHPLALQHVMFLGL